MRQSSVMAFSEDIHNTQQLANAAEAFISALGALFPGDTFDQFFHSDTLRQAYWSALQSALEGYATPEHLLLAKGLLNGQVLADERVIGELLKLFLPGQRPDYEVVVGSWAEVLSFSLEESALLAGEAETLFALLEKELRQSPDLRTALLRLAQSRQVSSAALEDVTSTAVHDLNRLLEAELISGPSTLNLQVRHLIALAGVRGGVEPGMDTRWLSALVMLARILPPDDLQRVWTSLDTLDDPALKLRLLGQIAPHLNRLEFAPDPLALIHNAIQSNNPSLDPAVCAEVLLDLVPHLDAPNQDRMLPPFQQRVLAGVQVIEDPASRVRALGALIENFPPELQGRAVSLAFDAADSIPSDMARAAALSVLPPHLPPDFHVRLLGFAYDFEDPDARALLLGRMIPYLPPELQAQALTGALNAIEEMTGDDARTAALIALAPYIDSVGPLQYIPEGLQQAISVTFSIESPDDRARAFAALAPYLSPELLTEALHVLRQIQDDHDRTATLTRLAPHLPLDLQVAAFAIAQEITPAEERAAALSAIAPYLSLTARAEALADALVAALAIQSRYERVVALADLAPHLPEDLQWRAMQEALTASRSIPNESERGRALVFLAPHLPEGALADALADAYTILDPLERVPALSALMPFLPEEPRLRVAQDALNLARLLKPPHHKASILASIAPVLPYGLVESAMTVALEIDMPYDRMHVLAALLPRQPEELHDEVLAAAYAVPDRYQRVNALLELVPHTPALLRQPILDQALDTALGISDDYDRASALAHLAPYIDAHGEAQNRQQDALSLAVDSCLNIADSGQRAALLVRLAAVWRQVLTPAQSYPLWRRVVGFLRERPQAELLTDLAALAPVIDLMGAPGAPDDVGEILLRLAFEV